MKSTRAFTKEVEDIEREHSELFQRYFRLQEDYFLELHNKRFTSENNPKLGDVVHVKSLLNTDSYSVGLIVHI